MQPITALPPALVTFKSELKLMPTRSFQLTVICLKDPMQSKNFEKKGRRRAGIRSVAFSPGNKVIYGFDGTPEHRH